jgi:SAM-dependent methyltransferase
VASTPEADLDGDASGLTREIDAVRARGPRARSELVRLVDRGDWRARALTLSALGCLVRQDRTAHTALSLGGMLALVPGLRRRVNSVGRRGHLVSTSLANAAADRLFIVRMAAALALGECRDPALASVLAGLQRDPFRPVRIAASAGLLAIRAGSMAPLDASDLAPTPDVIADGAATLPWLRRLVSAHRDLLEGALATASGPAPHDDVASWLAGAGQQVSRGGVAFEAARYAQEVDLGYQRQKPFGHEDRRENLRQLDALLTLLAQLDLPRGARVVDLGGGSGWVAEFLARYGFRPVVVDVALPLLRLAYDRLDGSDLDGSVVAGDMTALPLRSESIDAVIVLDALHHVGQLSAVLAEVRRVLVPGGQLLIAEPGEGHSESAKSLAETSEHGVREGEVHPTAVWASAKAAGFTRGAIVPRTPATLVMPLDVLPAAMRTPADTWIVHDGGTVVRFETAVVRSMLARPLLVLVNGDRPRDSRAPGILRAHIRPALARAGRAVRGTVTVENAGDTLWLSASTDGVGVVSVGLQLLSPTSQLLDRECWRGRLPASVGPGGTVAVDVEAWLPSATGAYRLKIDLVAERVCWFEDHDSRPAVVDL